MGILPASTVKIKTELGLDNTWFGFLGSVVYGGQVIGSAIASGALQKINPKFFLSVCLALNILTLFIFTMTDIYIVLALCRMVEQTSYGGSPIANTSFCANVRCHGGRAGRIGTSRCPRSQARAEELGPLAPFQLVTIGRREYFVVA